MSPTEPRHLLFLSHAGVDREAAAALAEKIEASPTAKQHDLRVWIDKRGTGTASGLVPGQSWQKQIEDAIAQASAFAVYVPPAGVSYWVETEMRLAFSECAKRRLNGKDLPFIPIVPAGRDLTKVPATAGLYQAAEIGVSDGDLAGIDAIIKAALRLDDQTHVQVVEEPFVGLSAFDASTAGLFFGREKETQELVDKLRATNFVMVVSDSGAGKSSLVKAGLVPRFWNGVFANRMDVVRPHPGEWHVVEMRPGRDPFEGLVEGVSRAARIAGIPFDSATHGAWIRSRDPAQVRDALRETAPSNAKLLLIADQFEELWTSTPDVLRGPFITALLALAPPGDFSRRVVATMRRDYFNLCGEFPDLAARLEPTPSGGRFLLRRMTDEGLRAAVTRPLALAGEKPQSACDLAETVLRDITDQPGDLALLEMAVTEAWRRRREFDGSIVRAYEHIGRVEGALATVAEDAFANTSNDPAKLSADERPVAEALFMRLVHVGDAQGATRRVVSRDELGDDGWRVAQKLATKECRRLVVVGGPLDFRSIESAMDDSAASASERADAATVELAHEQLVTQWGRYQDWLQNSTEDPDRADDKRRLDRLMDRAERWRDDGGHGVDLARGSDLSDFGRVIAGRGAWLSETERQFVQQSEIAWRRQARRRRWVLAAAVAFALLFVLLWRKSENLAIVADAQALWHPLEFQNGEAGKDEIDGLWRVAAAPTAVRAAFLQQMFENDELAERFCRASRAIVHAMVGIDCGKRHVALQQLHANGALSTRSDRTTIAAGMLAAELEDASAIDMVIAGIETATDPYQVGTLAQRLAPLSNELSNQQASRAAESLFTAIASPVDSELFPTLGQGLAALAGRLSNEQAVRAIGPLLIAMREATDYRQLATLGQALATLSRSVNDEQAMQAIGMLQKAIRAKPPPAHLVTMTHASAVLSDRLTHEQSPRVVNTLLTEIGSTTDISQLDILSRRLNELSATLTGSRASLAIEPLLTAIEATTNWSQLRALARGFAPLSDRLTVEQAARAIEAVIAAISKTTDRGQLNMLVRDLLPLSAKLDDRQAARLVEPLLAAIKTATDAGDRSTFVAGLVPLWNSLNGGQAAWVLEVLLLDIEAATSPYHLAAAARVLEPLAGRLNERQAARATGPLLTAIEMATERFCRLSLGRSLGPISQRLRDRDADRAIRQLLVATEEIDRDMLDARSKEVVDLWASLSDPLAARSVEPLFAAINTTTNPYQLAMLGQGLAALPTDPNDDHACGRVRLAVLTFPHLAASSRARDALAQSLRDRFTDAPRQDAGWWALIEWAERCFPDFDFRNPPMRSASADVWTSARQ